MEKARDESAASSDLLGAKALDILKVNESSMGSWSEMLHWAVPSSPPDLAPAPSPQPCWSAMTRDVG